MTFVPGGATSPGSNVMRQEGYDLSKREQLFHDIRFYDPRFKRSSNLLNDILAGMGSIALLDEGRDEQRLQKSESFEVMRITAQTIEVFREEEGIAENIVAGLQAIENQKFPKEEELFRALEEQIGPEETARYKDRVLQHVVIDKQNRGV
jgi:hypothetical protein